MELHEIIKQRRIKHGLTQEELAEKMHITRQSISRWETGKTNPPLNALYDLADIYNLSLEEFLGGKIMKQRKLNFLALLGSLFFNFFLLTSFGVILLSLWLSAWIIIISFFLSPVILFVGIISGLQNFIWQQSLFTLILPLVASISFNPLIILSKNLYRMVVKYFRYNLSNIYYDIE